MPELTREEKLKLIEKLPQGLQDFLYSEDTGAFLLSIGQKYNLTDEKISALSKITADIVLKITPITSLAQEIVNKVTPDHQIAMIIAQELNHELLTPVLMPTPVLPISTAPAVPITPTPVPATPRPVVPAAPTSQLAPTPKTDQYREPTTGGPEIIDLRTQPEAGPPLAETPPPPIQMPVAAAPAYIPPPKPLTFTKPVEKIPLIEAEPHKTSVPTPAPQAPQKNDEEKPQFIVRPPGLAPTDLPHDVLDLRKDKGEF